LLEAHATAVLLGGFEHESFYLDGSLSSLLDPAAFRRERYAQYRDMRGMDPGRYLQPAKRTALACAVWVVARTSGQQPVFECPFGSHAAPNVWKCNKIK
jgi:hypothetical protein